MSQFIEGAIMMGNVIIALFFLRFWRMTRDRLLGVFSLSFLLLALARLVRVLVHLPSQHVHYVYLIRLLAYVLIIYAIVDKNAPSARRARSTSSKSSISP